MVKKAIIIFLISLLFINSMFLVVYAQSESKKENLQNQLTETQQEKSSVLNQKKSILAEIDELNEKILECQFQIDDLNKQLSNLQKSINVKKTQIKKLEKEYIEKEEAFVDRIVAIYESGQTTYLDVLLSSDSVISFISNYYMIEELAEADNIMLNSIHEQQKKIEDTKSELETEKASITYTKNEIEIKTKELNKSKASKKSKLISLSNKEKKLQKEIEQYQLDIKNIEKQIKEYEDKNHSNSSNYTGGKLHWPVEGYYSVSSKYGYRIHPIYGYNKLHTGIDIAATRGANFLAAEDGTVISASYSGGYGNRVVISHGNGLSTLYAHGTSILVKAGQKVKRGQPVLTVRKYWSFNWSSCTF